MTTLDDRPTTATPTGAEAERTPTASASATAGPEDVTGSNAEGRRGRGRGAGARARIAVASIFRKLLSITRRVPASVASSERRRSALELPGLLDCRPRTLREQRAYIKAHQIDRPSPTGADTSKLRVCVEHAHDAGLWLLFWLKAAAMSVEWCCESYKRVLVLVVIVAALVALF